MDQFLKGLLIGAIAPLLAFVLSTLFSNHLSKPFIFYVFAALANLLLLRYFYKQQQEQPARAVILLTFIGALVLLFTHPGI